MKPRVTTDDDNSLSSQSSVVSSPPSSRLRKLSERKCTRCRNHNELVDLKGHKRQCPYRLCRCFKCEISLQRQAMQTKFLEFRRYKKNMKAHQQHQAVSALEQIRLLYSLQNSFQHLSPIVLMRAILHLSNWDEKNARDAITEDFLVKSLNILPWTTEKRAVEI